MELQWPLIVFTTLVTASAGLFGVQGAYAIAGNGQKAQPSATVTSLVLLVAGCIAALFHLGHGERIFNGFGNPGSGITQELMAIVVIAVLMVLFLLLVRRRTAPKWLAVLAIVAAIAAVATMGGSYMVDARPAWNNVFQVFSLIGAACAMGAALFAVADAAEESDFGLHGSLNIMGAIANCALTIAYLAVMSGTPGKLVDMGAYFDPVHPTYPLIEPSAFSPFAGSLAVSSAGAILLAVVVLVLAIALRKTKRWRAVGTVIAVCVVLDAVLLRMTFYAAGGSVFLLY